MGAGQQIVAGAGPSIFVYDTFGSSDGTNLTGRTPEIGGGWNVHGSFSGVIETWSGRAAKTATSSAAMYYATAQASGDLYGVRCTFREVTTPNLSSGIAGWVDTSADTMIVLRRTNSTTLTFFHQIAGATTSLWTETNNAVAGNDLLLDMAQVRDNVWEIWVNLVSKGQFTITDTAFDNKRRVGFRMTGSQGTAAGYQGDNFYAYQ